MMCVSLMEVWFCSCLLVSSGNGLVLTGCSWLLCAACSSHFQLIWRCWELCFEPAYVGFARSSHQAEMGSAAARGGPVLLRNFTLACRKSPLSPVLALGCSLSCIQDCSGVNVR